jgi:hypothetical protein
MGLPRISGRAAPLEATYSFVATQLALSSAIIVEEHQVFLQTQPFGGLDELPVPIENPSPHCLFRLQQVFVEYKRAWAKILDSQERTEAKLMQLFPPLFPESLRRAKLVSFASTLENTKKLANSALVREVQQTLTSANPAPAVDNKAKQIFAQCMSPDLIVCCHSLMHRLYNLKGWRHTLLELHQRRKLTCWLSRPEYFPSK